MTFPFRSIAFILCFAFGSHLAAAQDEIPTRVNAQNRTGDLPFSTTIGSDIERVDVATGNLIVNIPIVSRPGRGLDANLGLTYNAMFWIAAPRLDNWGQQIREWKLEKRGAPYALGWSESKAKLTSVSQSFNCASATAKYQMSYIYQDPSGGKHPLAYQRSLTSNCPINDLQGPDLTGEGIWGVASGISDPNVLMPDGTLFAGGTWRDSNGNSKTDTDDVGIVDTLGRQIVAIETPTNQRLYKVFDSGGIQRTYTVNFGTVNLATAFNSVPTCEGLLTSEYTGAATVITSIVLPNGTSYGFQYESGSYGALTRIDLPTGGSISYTWTTLLADSKTRRRVATRTVSVGDQTYTWTFNGGTVTDPAGNQTVYTTTNDGDAITSASFYEGTATGTPKRRYQIDYVSDGDPWHDTANPSCSQEAQPVGVRPIRVTTTLDDGRVSKTEFDYETFTYPYHPYHSVGGYSTVVNFTTSRGNVSEIREYEYGAVPATYGQGVPGSLVRRTARNFLHNITPAYKTYNIVNKVLSETVYDAAGNTKAQTDYEYDSTALLSSAGAPQHDDTNFSTSFLYRGNPTRVKRWRNTDNTWLTTTYNYDVLGNIRSIVNPRNDTTTFGYADRWANTGCAPPSDSRAYVTDITNAENHRVQLTYYPCSGLKQARRDENDILNNRAGTTFIYDLLDRLTRTDYPDGGQTSVAYSDSVPFRTTTTTKIDASQNRVEEIELDGLGRPVLSKLLDPQGTVFARTAYDGFGRVIQSWNPTRCNPDNVNCGEATYGITQTEYDALGRVTKVIPPDGIPASNHIATSYLGNTVTVTDQAGKARKQVTDALGRLTEVVEDPAIAAYSTTYGYDVLDNLTSVVQDVQTRTFVYDSLSHLRSATNPESGTIQYTYDANGNVSTRTDARSTVTTYGYDSLDRLTSKTYTIAGTTAGTPNVTYGYDALAVPCNSKGRLTSVTSSVSTTRFGCFDAMGRPTQSSQETGGLIYPFSYGYDLAGDRTGVIYPSGKTLYTTIDAAQRTAKLSRAGGVYYAGDASTSIQYAPHGAIRQVKLGNNLWDEMRFSSRLQPKAIGLGGPNATALASDLNTTNSNLLLLEFGYGHGTNNNGNVQNQTIRIGGTSFSQYYTYDAFNRLATAAETGGWSHTYLNDRYGNMRPSGVTYTIDEATNKLTVASGYQYDGAGNLTVDSTQRTFAYDAENRQTSYNTGDAALNATYEYDGDGRRVKKVQNGVTTIFVYDVGGQLSAEYSTATPGPSGTQYFTVDHLGSNRIVTDGSGNVVSRHDYYPFGEEIASSISNRSSIATAYSVTDNFRQKFTGKERDAESGLDFFGARYLSAAQGRFTAVDPALDSADPLNPQTWNRYAYVLNNPLRLKDPDGRFPVETFLDLASLGKSVWDFGRAPSWAAAGYVAWDAGSVLLPYVPGSWVRRVTELGYAGLQAAKSAVKFENALEAAAAKKYLSEGVGLLAAGGKQTNEVLGISSLEKGADFLGVTQSGRYVIGEAKGGNVADAVSQLQATATGLIGKQGNVDFSGQILLKAGQKLDDPNYRVVGNQLQQRISGTDKWKQVTVSGQAVTVHYLK